MAQQTIIWTALPNGYSDDGGSLRISILVSPRLEPDADERLKSFPDFMDWPATLDQCTFNLRFGAGPIVRVAGNDREGPLRVDDRIGLANSTVWRALFPAETPVQGFQWRDLTNHKVLSFPAAEMDALVRGLYSRLAAMASDQLPTAATFLGDPQWRELLGAVTKNDRAFTNPRTGIRDTNKQFTAFKDGAFQGDSLNSRLARFQLFHTPPSKAQPRKDKARPGDPKRTAEWLAYEQVPMPKAVDLEKEFHFHKIVAAMNQYPTLLRELGLVIDLLVRRDAFTPSAAALLSVEVELPPGSEDVVRVPDASPRTRTLLAETRFQPVPRAIPAGQAGFKVANGLLEIDPQSFALLQADVDGSGLKVMSFAESLLMQDDSLATNQIEPVTKKPRELGAPSLRNAGLMLVHRRRGELLEATIKRQNDFNSALPVKPIMFAQDLIRGYRIDIWDDVTGQWHSLCQRQAIYNIDSGTVIIDVPAEEGTVRLAATTSRDENSNPDVIWLHETLVSWAGWSLCAPPPGKTIHHQTSAPDPDDPNKEIVVHEDPVGEPEAEVPPGLRLESSFRPLPGTLPRLRYGRRYRIRARAVDLAGNSLVPQANDFGSEGPQTNAQPYLRFDPISAPSIALVKRSPESTETPAEGESMERMAVRSLNDTPDLNSVPTTQRTRRFAVPSRTTHREAEQHGMLDRGGIVDPAFYTMLSRQDNSLERETVESPAPLTRAPAGDLPGPIIGPGPGLDGEPKRLSPPAKTTYAVLLEDAPLPYLPDPLAVEIAARILDHPTFPADQIIRIPFYAGTQWPEALPFKIEIYENPADTPRYDEASRRLLIPLPKAVRATLRLSVMPNRTALSLLGVWNWLTPAQQTQQTIVVNGQTTTRERLARNGQHWMLTPWRNIELVHAVQRPLITPALINLQIERRNGQTVAQPLFSATCSIASTDRVDLRANWNEPFDDGPGKPVGNHARIDHAFSMKITEPKDYNASLDYTPAGTNLIANNSNPNASVGGAIPPRTGKLHEFHDTRYRRVEYWLEATSKFREFMTSALLIEGGKPTEEHIRVVGPKVRTWIPASAPPPAPEVLYVVPTFGWVRSADDDGRKSWRRGGGLRVYLNRPWNASGYGEMLAVVLPRANFNGDPNDVPASKPLKNYVTQWGNDPIWLSDFVPGVAPRIANFPLARTKRDLDGKWLPEFAPSKEADQRPVPFRTTALAHPDFLNPPAEAKVDIAPHDVFYDEERQLWYCDIEVTWGASYYPFIRLALARYQPEALELAHLSNIVLADFMQLIPDRWLNVTYTSNPRTRNVRVFGNTYSNSSSHQEARLAPSTGEAITGGTSIVVRPPDVAASSVVEVWVESLDPTLGEDFGWKRETSAFVINRLAPEPTDPRFTTEVSLRRARTRANELLIHREFEALAEESLIPQVFAAPTLWEGSVTLPNVPINEPVRRLRLAIAEYEEYLVDDADNAYDAAQTKGRRMVFVEYVEL